MRTVRVVVGGWSVPASSPTTFLERLRGLDHRRAADRLLIEARSVHTFGIGRPMGFVVIDRHLTVADTGTLAPNRLLIRPGARFILEVPAGSEMPPVRAAVEIIDA